MERDWWRNAIVEFVGTFALVFLGCGAVVVTGGQNLVAIGLAFGLAIGVMVASAGHISGGVYNPALVCGLVVARRMQVGRGAYYIVAQMLGGLVAALALKAIFPPAQADLVQLGTPMVAPGFSVGAALLAEGVATFFLMYAVFGVAVDLRGARAIAGTVIGFTISIDIFAIGGVSGGAMNPARWFGPAAAQGYYADWWVWWVGPIVGAVVAAVLWNEVYLRERGAPTEEAASIDIEQTSSDPEPEPEPEPARTS